MSDYRVYIQFTCCSCKISEFERKEKYGEKTQKKHVYFNMESVA